jgi:hypothetical protein
MPVQRNEIRRVITDFAKKKGICTQCLRAYAKPHRVQCERCTKLNRDKWNKKQAKKRIRAKQREYDRKYARKKLAQKVTKLDKIRHAVEQGKPLPPSSTLLDKK